MYKLNIKNLKYKKVNKKILHLYTIFINKSIYKDFSIKFLYTKNCTNVDLNLKKKN